MRANLFHLPTSPTLVVPSVGTVGPGLAAAAAAVLPFRPTGRTCRRRRRRSPSRIPPRSEDLDRWTARPTGRGSKPYKSTGRRSDQLVARPVPSRGNGRRSDRPCKSPNPPRPAVLPRPTGHPSLSPPSPAGRCVPGPGQSRPTGRPSRSSPFLPPTGGPPLSQLVAPFLPAVPQNRPVPAPGPPPTVPNDQLVRPSLPVLAGGPACDQLVPFSSPWPVRPSPKATNWLHFERPDRLPPPRPPFLAPQICPNLPKYGPTGRD